MDLTEKSTKGTFALILIFTALVGLTIGMSIGKLIFPIEKISENDEFIAIADSNSYRGLTIITEPGKELANMANIDVKLKIDKKIKKIKEVLFQIEYWESYDPSDKKTTKAKRITKFDANFVQKIKKLKSGTNYKYRVIIDGGYANKEKEFNTKYIFKGINLSLKYAKIDEFYSIRPWYEISYEGARNIDLSKLKIRYYYTIDSENEQSFICDYAGLSGSIYANVTNHVKGNFFKMERPINNADSYLEVTFSEGINNMSKDSKLEVKCRFNKNNWQNFDKFNDYSFNNSSDFNKSNKVTLYYNDELIYGNEPK